MAALFIGFGIEFFFRSLIILANIFLIVICYKGIRELNADSEKNKKELAKMKEEYKRDYGTDIF